jgi:hypothetical protein
VTLSLLLQVAQSGSREPPLLSGSASAVSARVRLVSGHGPRYRS